MGTDQETVEKPAIEAKNDSIRQEYTFAPDVKLKECKYCRVMIPEKARICPNCKTTLKSHVISKTIAAVLILAVVAAGAYCLFTYRGSLPESATTALKQQEEAPMPDVSVNTVGTTETAAGARTVEPTEVENTALTVEFEQTAPPTETAQAERFAGIGEMQNEEAESTAENVGIKDEDAKAEGALAEDKEDSVEGKTAENVFDEEDEDDSEDKHDIEDQDTTEYEETEEAEEAEDNNSATALKDIDEDEAAFRADCVQRKYKSLLRDKEYLETEVLVREAEVVCQVDGGLFDENAYYLCREEENGNDCYYIIRDDRQDDETLILDGDIITVYGRLFGTCKIPINLIETRPTVPAISMMSYDLLEE